MLYNFLDKIFATRMLTRDLFAQLTFLYITSTAVLFVAIAFLFFIFCIVMCAPNIVNKYTVYISKS